MIHNTIFNAIGTIGTDNNPNLDSQMSRTDDGYNLHVLLHSIFDHVGRTTKPMVLHYLTSYDWYMFQNFISSKQASMV
jgi:hypothetical protein